MIYSRFLRSQERLRPAAVGRRMVAACFVLAAAAGFAPTLSAESGVGRFFRRQADNFIEARFQQSHPKRVVHEQVIQSEERSGKWTQQPLPTLTATLYFTGEVENKEEDYDATGTRTASIEFSDDGDVLKKVVRKSTGETLHVEQSTADDNTIRIVTIGSTGNKIEQDTYDKNMFLIARDTYSYDSSQNLVGVNHEGGLDRVALTYNADGQELTRTQLGAGDESLSVTRFRYDKAGELTEAATYSPYGALTRREVWTYNYDRHGLLIRKVVDVVEASTDSTRHYQIATIRNVTYVLTFGGILESAGETFGILLGSLVGLLFLIGGFNWVRESIADAIKRARKTREGAR